MYKNYWYRNGEKNSTVLFSTIKESRNNAISDYAF